MIGGGLENQIAGAADEPGFVAEANSLQRLVLTIPRADNERGAAPQFANLPREVIGCA